MTAQANTQTKQNNSVVVGGRTYTHASTDRRFLARVLATDFAHISHPIVLAILATDSQYEVIAHCNKDMEDLYTGLEFGPIPEVDWTQVEVDTPIWVRTTDRAPWVERHFSKFDPTTNTVYAWNNGYTSHTGEWSGYSRWDQAALTDPKTHPK